MPPETNQDAPHRLDSLFLAEEGTLRMNRQPLYYRRLLPLPKRPHRGPTLVFLHEALGCTAMWHAFPARVAAALPRTVVGIVTEAAHVFVEPITRAGIRTALAAFAPRQLEQRLARYHGARTRALFFAWADTWLSETFRDWNIEACLARIRCPALLLPACGHIPHRSSPRRGLQCHRGLHGRSGPLKATSRG